MKKLAIMFASLAVFALTTPSFAGDTAKEKERTLKGEAKCAKCMLKEGDKCQTVIQVKGKDGKPVNYYVVDNEVAKNFHENVCHGSKEVTAKGTVKTVDGKKEFTASKIEVAKAKTS
ncbi:MAG: hypothetical protein C5B50_15595 [Verrucomicrobia bacterium]|nr:MAG: hypothetical protein C5B50_15595 [Verrucomicrobiota bacterium]